MSNRKVVLVTGASSGFGREIAALFARNRYDVFGTSRNPPTDGIPPGVTMVALDVRSDESVSACVDTVLRRAGHLDVLVNNAGYVQLGAIEEVTSKEAKAQFETNFFGVDRMVKAVLPTMRKQAGGRIINIGSLAGLIPAPFIGFYSASKFALEGYTETLRYELKPFGIRVSLVEPGFFRTNIGRNRLAGAAPISAYDRWRSQALRSLGRFEDDGGRPVAVAECVLRVAESPSPALRYRVGADAHRYARLRQILPASIFERGVRRAFRLDVES